MALTMGETDKLFQLYMNFDKRMREILVEYKTNPIELADKMDVPRNTIYRYMSSGGHPDMLNLMKMADALGISMDEVVGIKRGTNGKHRKT